MDKNQPLKVAFGVFGVWTAAVLALFQLDWPWIANAVIVVWMTATTAAFVLLLDQPRRQAIADYVDSPGYDRLYLRLVRPVAVWPRDWRCYDWALRLAVLYPILSMVLIWAVTGKAGTIGAVQFLPASDSWATAIATLVAIAVAFSATRLEKWAAASRKFLVRRISGWLPLFPFAAAFVFAFAFASPSAGALAVAVVVAVAGPDRFPGMSAVDGFALELEGKGTFVVAMAVSVALAFAFLFAFAFAVACAVAYLLAFAVALAVNLNADERGALAYGLFTLIIALCLIAALTYLPWADTNDGQRAIFLFLGLLPIVNALTDYASYAITIGLVRQGLKTPGWAFVMSLVDIGAALALFTLLGALLVAVVAGANALAGVPLFPLAPLFAGLREDPTTYLWVYAMLFSTLVSTLVHLIVGVFSMIALPFFALIDLPVSRWIKTPDHTTALAGPVCWALPLLYRCCCPVCLHTICTLGRHSSGPALPKVIWASLNHSRGHWVNCSRITSWVAPRRPQIPPTLTQPSK